MRKLKENSLSELSIEAYDLGVADFENVGSEKPQASFFEFINQVIGNSKYFQTIYNMYKEGQEALYQEYLRGWEEAEAEAEA